MLSPMLSSFANSCNFQKIRCYQDKLTPFWPPPPSLSLCKWVASSLRFVSQNTQCVIDATCMIISTTTTALNPSTCLTKRCVKMIIMRFLVGTVPNKHVPLHLENKIWSRASLWNHSASFIMVCFDTFYPNNCSPCCLDSALGHIAISKRCVKSTNICDVILNRNPNIEIRLLWNSRAG